MAFKVVLYFAHPGGGWSETIYSTASSQSTAFNAATALATVRATLLADPCSLVAIRTSDEDNPRASALTGYKLLGSANPYVSKADNISTCFLLNLYSDSQTRQRPMYLRGNPDDAFDEASPSNADRQIWLGALQNLKDFILDTQSFFPGWQLKFKPRPDPLTNTNQILTWAAANPSSRTLIGLQDAATANPGDLITVYAVRGLPRPPGVCKVLANGTDSQHKYIAYRTPTDFNYEGGGYIVEDSPSYSTITYIADRKWTHRDTGRVFDQSRGRRRAIPK